MLQLPPDSQAASLSQTLPEATLGAPPPEPARAAEREGLGALVPTTTTRLRGVVVTLLEVCLRLVTLPSSRTTRKVTVRVPARPVSCTFVLPRARESLVLRTVPGATFCFFVTFRTSTSV